MQQQFPHSRPSNLPFSSLSQELHPVIHLNAMSSSRSKKYIDFQLTSLQLQQVQAKLPSIYMLINPNNGDLDKMRQNYKNQKSMGMNYEQPRENPTSPKVLGGEGLAKSHSARKKKKKQGSQKQKQDDKEGKIKKNSLIKKKIIEKKSLAKNRNDDKKNDLNFEEELQVAEGFERSKPKESQILKRQEGEKQKQAKKRKNFQKQPPILEQNPQATPPVKQNLMQFQLKVPILPLQNRNIPQNQQIPISFAIPNLRTGLPRYTHRAQGQQNSDTIQVNNLKFMFGLHYGLPFDVPVPRLNEKQKNFCNNVLQKLKSHKSSQSFRVPVDPIGQGVPDYHFSIYNPMDLQTISKKLAKDKYRSTCEFHADINTIFLNSYKYNLRGTFYFQAAIGFQDYYHSVLKDAEERTQEYAKEFMSKASKVKKVENFGELQFTQQTPFKKRRKGQGNKSMNLMRSQTLENINQKVQNIKKLNSHNDQNFLHSNSFLNEFGSSLNSISVDDKTHQNRAETNQKIRKMNSSSFYEPSGTQFQTKGIIPEHSHSANMMSHSFQSSYPLPYFQKGFKSQSQFIKFSQNPQQYKHEIQDLRKQKSEMKKLLYPYETQKFYGTPPIYQQEVLSEHENFRKQAEMRQNRNVIPFQDNSVFQNEKMFIEPHPFMYHNAYNAQQLEEYMGIQCQEMMYGEGQKQIWGKGQNKVQMTKRESKIIRNDDYNDDDDSRSQGDSNLEPQREFGRLQGTSFGINYGDNNSYIMGKEVNNVGFQKRSEQMQNKKSDPQRLSIFRSVNQENQVGKQSQNQITFKKEEMGQQSVGKHKGNGKRMLNPNLARKHEMKVQFSSSHPTSANKNNRIGPKSLKNKKNYSDEEYRCSDDEDEFVGNILPKKIRERPKKVSIKTENNDEVYLPRKKEKQHKNKESGNDHHEERSFGLKSGPSFQRAQNPFSQSLNQLGKSREGEVKRENSQIFMQKNESEQEQDDGIDLQELL